MQFKEYGEKNEKVILLLHGGGLSWWNYKAAAERLQSRFRVILPILDGHGGSDREFSTIEENAREIIEFVDKNLGGSVLLMGGVSLGGQILLEILSQRKDICRYALVESAQVMPSRLVHALIQPVFGSSYSLIRQRWFAKIQAAYLKIPEILFEDYFRDTCRISKGSMIAFMKENVRYSLKETIRDCSAEVTVLVGEKELRSVKQSAKRIQEAIPESNLHILPGLQHGEFSLLCASDYGDFLQNIVIL